MSPNSPIRRAQVVMCALGGCPTPEPMPELAQRWRDTMKAHMRGDAGARGVMASMREYEIGAWLDEHPDAKDEVDALEREMREGHYATV